MSASAKSGASGRPRRLLVVANPYPPMASAGTTRVVRFLRHLPEHGWEPTVLAAKAAGLSVGVGILAIGNALLEVLTKLDQKFPSWTA